MGTRRDVLKMALGGAALLGGPARAASDLYVPSEEAPHQGTLMQWPNNRRVYRDRFWRTEVQQTIAEIANTITAFEPVYMLADRALHDEARKLLSAQVVLWDIPTDDLWCRDSGPLFAFRGRTQVVSHIQFNGWGRKQRSRADDLVARRVAEHLALELVPSGLSGEAGGVEHDGHGLLLAHESSWVNKNRNPRMTRAEIEQALLQAYGATKMIWSRGVYGQDITDYHIDSLARFVAPGRVLVNVPQNPDPEDPFHMAALQTVEAIRAHGLEVEILFEPERRRVDDWDFVASYANYYLCNKAVVMAEFGDKIADTDARSAISNYYPNREIVSLNVDPLGQLGGGIHCATQQIPAIIG